MLAQMCWCVRKVWVWAPPGWTGDWMLRWEKPEEQEYSGLRVHWETLLPFSWFWVDKICLPPPYPPTPIFILNPGSSLHLFPSLLFFWSFSIVACDVFTVPFSSFSFCAPPPYASSIFYMLNIHLKVLELHFCVNWKNTDFHQAEHW